MTCIRLRGLRSFAAASSLKALPARQAIATSGFGLSLHHLSHRGESGKISMGKKEGTG